MEPSHQDQLEPDGGGFVPHTAESSSYLGSHGLLSPAASAGTLDSVSGSSVLPRPRRRPLKAGSAKESTFTNYLDARLRRVQRRFGLKTVGAPDTSDDSIPVAEQQEGRDKQAKNAGAQGYRSFVQAASDISQLLSIVWLSGTPWLQIPYLLTFALLVTSYIPAFPAAPKSMFALLQKLDYAFASLVRGRDYDSGDILPGFWGDNDGGSLAGLDETTKVRIRSLVERTRVIVVDIMNKSEAFDPTDNGNSNEASDSEITQTDEDNSLVLDLDDFDIGDDWDMEIARVYDRTLVELGGTLGTEDTPMLTAD